MKKIKFLTLPILILGLASTAFGAAHKGGENMTSFQQVFLKQFSSESDKLVSLAEAFSEQGYAWRPAEGIRSVREAILHVASGNYNIASRLGKAVPAGVNPRGFDKSVNTKADTIQTLKDSIAFAKAAVMELDEAGLETEINLFGQQSPKMAAVMVVGGHTYEHLGQLIAYARSYGVVPPWSQ
ncbi:MAG: DinB family protein [Verrucomicrobiae bacterium]|nr:DinB family protein [Verrucomicrobiae bacterium]